MNDFDLSPNFHHEIEDVEFQLNQLGLNVEILRNALEYGMRQRLNEKLTKIVTPTYGGISQWAQTAAGLYEQLIPQWEFESDQNVPFFINPSDEFCVTTYSGCNATGTQSTPTNKTRKGAKTQSICLRNNPTGDLFPETIKQLETNKLSSLKTWILLYHLDASDTNNIVLKSELSMPSSFERKHIIGWSKRIILPAIHYGSDVDITAEETLPDLDIQIPVSWKQTN